MFKHVQVSSFNGVPYLKGSDLMKNHPNGLTFSVDKPNVVIGPNGAGKSALMKALALSTLSYYTGSSSLDDKYVLEGSVSHCPYWGENGYDKKYNVRYVFLPGFEADTDRGPALYYKPNLIPGDDSSPVVSMVNGYWDQARSYMAATEKSSSGQGCQNLLGKVLQALNEGKVPGYGYAHWRFGKELRDLKDRGWIASYDKHAEELKKLVAAISPDAGHVVLLDEPEQSLDAVAEQKLWHEVADCKKLQVIAATHSLYPILHPDKFHIIEAVPGYADQVRSLLQ